jgi:putative IMPACT (imprinted ancient) family translation regulator
MQDTYKTIEQAAEGYIIEKKSKFLSFVFHVESPEEVKGIVDEHRKKYYDARHVCWAYMLGPEREEYRSNDDEAAEDAVKNAEIVEKTVDRALTVRFEYVLLNDVMRTLKQFEEVSWEQNFKESCTMKLRIRKSEFQRLHDSLSQIYGVKIEKE